MGVQNLSLDTVGIHRVGSFKVESPQLLEFLIILMTLIHEKHGLNYDGWTLQANQIFNAGSISIEACRQVFDFDSKV